MGTTPEQSRRYRQQTSNPFGIDFQAPNAGEGLARVLSRVAPPEQNPLMQIIAAQLQIAKQAGSPAFSGPMTNPRQVNAPMPQKPLAPGVMFDLPAALGGIGSQIAGNTNNVANNAPPVAAPGRALDGAAELMGNIFSQFGKGFGIGNGPQPKVAPQQVMAPRPAQAPAGQQARSPWYGQVPGGTPARQGYQPSEFYQRILGLEGGMDRNGKFLTSPAGAYGPAQLMPGTAPEAMELAGYSRNDQRWKTDATINKQAGEAYYNKQLRTFKDPVIAAAAYNAGPGNVQKALQRAQKTGGSWTQFLPAETQAYVQNFQTGRAGGLGPGGAGMGLQSPFDPSVFGPMSDMIENSRQQALQPSSVFVARPDAPAMPDMPTLPKRDFANTDASLQDMKPVMMMEADQAKLRRANLFKGLAEGLASTPDGAGLGKVLANLGAGLLAGRAAGDMEIQRRVDIFDQKMAEFKAMTFKYEDAKADTKYNEAVAEVKGMYEHNMKKWEVGYRQWEKDYSVQQGPGGQMIITSPTKGGLNVATVPLAPIVNAMHNQMQIELAGTIASGMSQGRSQVAGIMNALTVSELQNQAANGTPEQQAEAMVTNTAFIAAEAVTNKMLPGIVGDEHYGTLVKTAQEYLTQGGIFPGTDGYDKALDTQVTSLLVQDMSSNPALRKQFQTVMPQIFERMNARRMGTAKETATTDSRGRTTRRVTTDAGS